MGKGGADGVASPSGFVPAQEHQAVRVSRPGIQADQLRIEKRRMPGAEAAGAASVLRKVQVAAPSTILESRTVRATDADTIAFRSHPQARALACCTRDGSCRPPEAGWSTRHSGSNKSCHRW